MSTKVSRFSLKDTFMQLPTRSRLFPYKLNPGQKHTSTSITKSPQNTSPKKIYMKGDKRAQSKSSLFKFNPAYLDQLASYGTNNKANKETKEKDSNEKVTREIAKKKLSLFEIYDKNKDLLMIKETPKKNSKNKKYSKSMKKTNSPQRTQSYKISEFNSDNSINSNEYNYDIEKEDDMIIVRKSSANSDVVENFLTLPDELKLKIALPELKIVSPSRNIEGNYSNYIHGVANSLKQFIEFDYDSIFSQENNDKIKYYHYTSSQMVVEDVPKKKLLLIDLDETLVHTEFRTRENFKELDTFVKKSKCYVKTFSFTDDNCVYYMDVFFRPYLKLFLQEISNYFDLAIFTAAMRNYADTILDYIDPENEYFKFRLYRDACIPIQNKLYIKDLRIIKDYDPSNVILMDNSLYSFMNQPSNGMLVNSFYTNPNDIQLINAKSFLVEHIFPCDDVRKECEKWYHFSKLFYKGTSKEKETN